CVVGAVLGGLAGASLGGLLGERDLGSTGNPRPVLSSPSPGAQPLQIAGPTLEGGQFDLQQWRGQVVLVDFWATWCASCLIDLPRVKQLYERYHNDGLEIVGINLDDTQEAAARFVQDRQIAWPQVFFPNRGPHSQNNPLVREFRICSVPE